MDFLINFDLFQRLTRLPTGSHRGFHIDEQGVEWIAGLPGASAHEQVLRRELTHAAQLRWPVLASQLVKWQEKNSCCLLPGWIHQFTNTIDHVEADRILQTVEKWCMRRKVRAARAITRAKTTRLLNRQERDALLVASEADFNDALLLLSGLSRVRALLSVGDGGGGEKASSRQAARVESADEGAARQRRSDLLNGEIQRGLEVLGASATPTEILTWLKQQSMRKGSCIVGTYRNGVQWMNASGEPKSTTLKGISQRLSRLKGRKVSPPR